MAGRRGGALLLNWGSSYTKRPLQMCTWSFLFSDPKVSATIPSKLEKEKPRHPERNSGDPYPSVPGPVPSSPGEREDACP